MGALFEYSPDVWIDVDNIIAISDGENIGEVVVSLKHPVYEGGEMKTILKSCGDDNTWEFIHDYSEIINKIKKGNN